MAQNELEWAFKLTDKAADPAKRIAANLKQVDDLLVKMTTHEKQLAMQLEKDPFKKQMKSLDLYRDKLKQQNDILEKNKERTDSLAKGRSSGMSALLGGLSGVAAAGAAAAVAVAAIGVAASVSAISTASMKRNTLSAFTVLTGSKDEAKELYAQITRIADVAPFETKDVSGMFRSLLGGGFKKDEIENTLKGVFDVGAILGGDEGKAASQSIVGTMLQIKSIGKMTFEDMKQISQAAGGLIPIDKIAAQIAAVRKVTSAEALKLISEGKVTAAEGQAAILGTIQQTADKGAALGTASLEFGTKSLEGVLSTLQSRFSHLTEDVDIQPIINLITVVSDFFNTAAGQEAKSLFTGIFDDLFAAIGKLGEGSFINDFFGAIVTSVKILRSVFEAIWPIVTAFWDALVLPFKIVMSVFDVLSEVFSFFFGGLGTGGALLEQLIKGLKLVGQIVGFLVGVFLVLAGVLTAIMAIPYLIGLGFYVALGYIYDFYKFIFETIWGVIGGTVTKFYNFGIDIVMGLWQGIKDAWTYLIEGYNSLVQGLADIIVNALGIHSDSKVMKELGLHIGGGLESGVEASAGGATSAIDSMVAPPAIAGGGGSLGNQMSFGDLSFSFGGGPTDQNEAREYGRTAAYEFKQTMAKLMSGAAVETGAG